MTGPRLARRNYGRGHGYQIDGAKLTLHGNEPGAVSRPKSLTESLTKEEHVLIVFEKEKK